MYTVKCILQYSNDGIDVERETILSEDEYSSLEEVDEMINYEIEERISNKHTFTKIEHEYISEWYKVKVKNLPYNRIYFKIENKTS